MAASEGRPGVEPRRQGGGDLKGGRYATSSVTIKKSHLVIIVAVIVLAIGVGAYFIISNMNKPDAPDNSNSGGIGFKLDPNAKDYSGDDPENKSGDAQGIKIPGYGTVRLPADKTDVKMILLNPEGNPCYFIFELVVDGETYYTSDLVEPSKCIEDLKLTMPLKKGEYNAVLKISCYSTDGNYTRMNGADVKFDLIVM